MPPAHRMPLENDIRHWVHVHLHPRQPTKTLYPKITSHDSTEHHSSDFQRTVLWPLSLPHPHPSAGHEGTNRIATQPPSPAPEAKRKPQDHITGQCLPDPVRQRPWNPNPFQRGMRQPALPQNRRVPSHPCQLLQAQGTSHTASQGCGALSYTQRGYLLQRRYQPPRPSPDAATATATATKGRSHCPGL